MAGWDPFSDDFDLGEGLSTGTAGGEERSALTPAADVFLDQDGMSLELELPGIHARELRVYVDGERVCVEADRSFSHAYGRKVVLLEGRYGRMRREFALPVRAMPEAVSAELVRGVLRIRIPRSPPTAEVTRALEMREERPVAVTVDRSLS